MEQLVCTAYSPWHSDQVLKQVPEVLWLGLLPPGRVGEGYDGAAPAVPAAGEHGEVLLQHGHHVHRSEAVHAPRA